MREALAQRVAEQHVTLAGPYHIVALALMSTTMVVGVFYCLDALHGERRDRSMLFWKSLPVSDRTAVLAKMFIPMVVLPVIALVVVLAIQLVMLVVSSIVIAASGLSAAPLWSAVEWADSTVTLIYGLLVLALWYAPIYAWLLLVSAWARRAVLLWAVLPFMVLSVFEKIAFGSNHLGMLLRDRIVGGYTQGFGQAIEGNENVVEHVPVMDPARLFSSPGLWLGVIAAALLLWAAIWLRRRQEPL
jgi:ABC-2 type transport system permease protein